MNKTKLKKLLKKKTKIGFTLVELLSVIVILAIILLITVTAVLPQMQKARRKAFADEGLVFAKAAENAYIDDQASGDMSYTIDYLREHYVTKSDDTYTGCVIVNTDESGRIVNKTIYLAQRDKFMILGETDTSLKKSLDKKIKDYKLNSTSGWSNKYSSCDFNSGITDISTSQPVVIDKTGLYSLEVWGAQGGACYYNNTYEDSDYIDPRNAPEKFIVYDGGYGAYAYGEIELTEGTTLYVNVGTKPPIPNEYIRVGTGKIYKYCEIEAGVGGGADGTEGYIAAGGGSSSITLSDGELSTLSLDDVIMIAGAGGGGKVTNRGGYSGGGAKDETGQVSQSGQYNSNLFGKAGGVGNGGGYYGSTSTNSNKSAARGGSGYIGNSNLKNAVMYGYNVAEYTEQEMKTISTTNVGSHQKNSANIGDGYARITYLGEV